MIEQAITAAENDILERAVSEAGCYAKHSATAKNIARAICSLKHRGLPQSSDDTFPRTNDSEDGGHNE
jgi:hypothetical protein